MIRWVGVVFVAAYFLSSGVKILRKLDEFTDFARSYHLSGARVLTAAGGVALVAGAGLLIPPATRDVGAGLIVAFLVAADLGIHRPWKVSEFDRALANIGWIGVMLVLMS